MEEDNSSCRPFPASGNSAEEQESGTEHGAKVPAPRGGLLRQVFVASPGYAALWMAEEFGSSALGAAVGILRSPLGADLRSYVVAVASALPYYATYALNVEQGLGLIQRGKTFISNPSAVIASHVSTDGSEDNERKRGWIARLGYVANPLELVKEWWWGTLFIPEKGPSIFFAGNVVAVVTNVLRLVESGIFCK